jgi:hypothetical protein
MRIAKESGATGCAWSATEPCETAFQEHGLERSVSLDRSGARKDPAEAFYGEAFVLVVDGIFDFNALRSRQHDEEVRLHASASYDARPSHALFSRKVLMRDLTFQPEVRIYNLTPVVSIPRLLLVGAKRSAAMPSGTTGQGQGPKLRFRRAVWMPPRQSERAPSAPKSASFPQCEALDRHSHMTDRHIFETSKF